MLSRSISSEVAWAAMMPWRAAALMAMTFCMTGSHWPLRCGASLGQIVNEPTFRDVCTPKGKWFRDRENCFVAASATKQFGTKSQQFEWDGFLGRSGAIRPPSLPDRLAGRNLSLIH